MSEAWVAGVLRFSARPEELREVWEERVAIMVADGGMPPADAERLAWEELQTQRAVP